MVTAGSDGDPAHRPTQTGSEAFSVAGGFRHFFIPNRVEANIFGSYANFDFGANATRTRGSGSTLNGRNVAGTRFGFVDFEEFRIGGNVIWAPVSGLNLGVEVLYARLDFDGRLATVRPAAGAFRPQFRVTDNEDSIEGRFRVQRDF